VPGLSRRGEGAVRAASSDSGGVRAGREVEGVSVRGGGQQEGVPCGELLNG